MHPNEAVTLWKACTGAGSWQDLWTHGVRGPHAGAGFTGRTCDPCWSSLFLKDCTLWKGPMVEQFIKNCSPWEAPMLEQFVENYLLWVEPHAGAGEESEQEREAEAVCDELTTTPIPHAPAPFVGKR